VHRSRPFPGVGTAVRPLLQKSVDTSLAVLLGEVLQLLSLQVGATQIHGWAELVRTLAERLGGTMQDEPTFVGNDRYDFVLAWATDSAANFYGGGVAAIEAAVGAGPDAFAAS